MLIVAMLSYLDGFTGKLTKLCRRILHARMGRILVYNRGCDATLYMIKKKTAGDNCNKLLCNAACFMRMEPKHDGPAAPACGLSDTC